MFVARLFIVVFYSSLAISMLSACTPALNWREVRFESVQPATNQPQLSALLPCKPDKATRPQAVMGYQVNLSMLGCQTAGATYTLSRIQVATIRQSDTLFDAWRKASMLAFLSAQAKAHEDGMKPFIIKGAADWPSATQIQVFEKGKEAHFAWFATGNSMQTVLYQAAIYADAGSKPLNAEAVNTFFESLKLQ